MPKIKQEHIRFTNDTKSAYLVDIKNETVIMSVGSDTQTAGGWKAVFPRGGVKEEVILQRIITKYNEPKN